MEYKLHDLDLDDEEGLMDDPQDKPFDPELDEKPWMEGPNYQTEQTEDPEPHEDPVDEDLVTMILKTKGINPEAIKIANEEGEVEEIPFNSLSKEEQLAIISDQPTEPDYDLDDTELEFLNELRTEGLTPQEYLEQYRLHILQEAMQNQEPSYEYEVDQIPDDELYLLDLKRRIPELTDEEAKQALDHEKSNETLYQRKVAGIRTEYKELEEAKIQQEEQLRQEQLKQQAEAYENEIIKAIQENDTIDLGDSELSLSEDDMNEIASFILDEDSAGVRYIAKALSNPQTLVGMAWYALKGQETFSQISDYYKQQIKEVANTIYNKGYEEAKKGNQKNAAKTVVTKKTPTAKPGKTITINDLD